jgi:2',3'-cyclic-nucleotide 2'-phosphodiesterase (5'-nucleotidase family)
MDPVQHLFPMMHHISNMTICIGDITLGDLLEILPFEDPIVVQALDGETIWNALEAGLSTWPAQEG